MDITRRRFCKLSALAAFAMTVIPEKLFASPGTKVRLSGRCSIDVIRCQCFTDLQCRYLDDPEAGPCARFHVGDRIEITPENVRSMVSSGKICPQAWRALEPYVMAALSPNPTEECAPALTDNQAIVSCPDGTRPVIFKVTAV